MLLKWFKAQFNGNPLVTDSKHYLRKVEDAFSFGLKAALWCIAAGMLGIGFVVIGILARWW